MAYYRTCPDCGGNLDPGERCECQDKRKTAPSACRDKKEELPGATNTEQLRGGNG